MDTKDGSHLTLPEVIRRRRRELELNQDEVAATVGVDRSVVSRMERGLEPIKEKYLSPLAKILRLEEASLRNRLEGAA